jgi:ribosomal protein L37AE/L43A
MTENDTETACRGAGEVQRLIDKGLCPKCQTPSVIEDTGDLGQCQSCGLYMGNNLKSEILETRQTVLQSEDDFETQHDLV